MSVVARLLRRSVVGLVRLACVLALVGLAIMSFAVVSGRPLPVVFAMSFGHLVGLASLACFLLAVLIDEIHHEPVVTAETAPAETPPKKGGP